MTRATGLASRRAARALLRSVLDQGRAFDDALHTLPNLAELEPRDRAFARKLAATVLRRLLQIDALIDHCLDRPGALRPAALRHDLRLAVGQMLFLDTPPHAAVDSAIRLIEQDKRLRGAKGFANAVLRRLSREGAGLTAQQDAALLCMPDWLKTRLIGQFGEKTTRDIGTAHLNDPPLDLTPRDPGQAEALAATLSAALLPTGSLRLSDYEAVPSLPGFDEGAWWVQDAAAALPVRLLGDVAGKAVIDLCAAPGGKTAQLCAAGAEVTAVDRSASRLDMVQQNLDRLDLTATLIAADGTDWRPARPVDAVLLDAPCTASGTLRRHPDIAHLKGNDDLAGLVPLQAALLDAAVTMLKPGGVLVYATCSLLPEEGERQIEAALTRHSALRCAPLSAADCPGLPDAITDDGFLRTRPDMLPGGRGEKGGIDGFFAARLFMAV